MGEDSLQKGKQKALLSYRRQRERLWVGELHLVTKRKKRDCSVHVVEERGWMRDLYCNNCLMVTTRRKVSKGSFQ